MSVGMVWNRDAAIDLTAAVSRIDDPYRTHMDNGVYAVENVANLSLLPSRVFTLLCCPYFVAAANTACCRVVATA